ncbi:MAG: bifunctional folylpolyglutamate synthase/dihydrofolate synthase [Acidimicrobiales bacterium]
MSSQPAGSRSVGSPASLPTSPPNGQADIEAFLLQDLPSMGPPPRGEDGLARSRRFFDLADSPQDWARQIHVVGTAGKGTATGAIVARLVGAGASVGAHLSPHVYDLRERFLLNGALPSWPEVDQALEELWPAVEELTRAEGRPPSFFELTTALSWVIGRRAGVDYHVTEAGIGGAFDATNAISRVDKLTVVMPIGYDHMEILGEDLESIAGNKVAVIPPGGIVIIASQEHQTAERVIHDAVHERGATPITVDPSDNWADQAEAVADAVTRELARDNPDLDTNTVSADAHLPGRMQRIETGDRVLILDGAHNPMKLRAVRASLEDRATVLVAALSQEKDLDACAAELAELADIVIATDFTVTAGDRVVRRSFTADELATAVKQQRPESDVRTISGIEEAVRAALGLAEPGETVVATGSFMMLEPVRDAASAVG